ncbi:MAG: TlpA family protein disulfide reductase, partial [Bacteroidales bacterium]|nr:TlpA family protein disulfide reductase [Bacteroidales bacterium]
FPKSGSFLDVREMMETKPSKADIKIEIEEKIKARQQELKQLNCTDDYFNTIEKARIQFDAANSFLSFGMYNAYVNKLPNEEMMASIQDGLAYFKADIDNYLSLKCDASILCLDAFGAVAQQYIELHGEENIDTEILDYLQTQELVYYLGSKGPVSEVLSRKQDVLAILRTEKYKGLLNKAFEKYNHLIPGQKAPALNFTTLDGKQLSLEAYKGKVLVIDVWATWCGPCKAESPYFEALAEKYANEEMIFVSISIDSSEKPWRAYLEKHEKSSLQVITPRSNFKEYELLGVPRFMILDKNGVFIDAFAPAPSNAAFENIIKSL